MHVLGTACIVTTSPHPIQTLKPCSHGPHAWQELRPETSHAADAGVGHGARHASRVGVAFAFGQWPERYQRALAAMAFITLCSRPGCGPLKRTNFPSMRTLPTPRNRVSAVSCCC